jgi:hydroxycarboxylate dehydrogenase B
MQETFEERGIINGLFGMILAPDKFGRSSRFQETIEQTTAFVKSAAPAIAGKPVLIAGEPERLSRASRLEHGIMMDSKSWSEIEAAAVSVCLAPASFNNNMRSC